VGRRLGEYPATFERRDIEGENRGGSDGRREADGGRSAERREW
jgi:hypothetical protein